MPAKPESSLVFWPRITCVISTGRGTETCLPGRVVALAIPIDLAGPGIAVNTRGF